MEAESHFDGGLFQLVGWVLLGTLITIVTLGICFPWAVCMVKNWEVKHTIINGKRLSFDGHAIQLFGKWILWLLLIHISANHRYRLFYLMHLLLFYLVKLQ